MTRLLTLAVLAATGVLSGPGSSVGQPVPVGPGCPALYILGVQGTGQSSVEANPTADTGMLGALLGPVVAAVPNLVQRSYIPYPAGFGGALGTGGDPDSYAVSVRDGVAALDAAATRITTTCPDTALAGVGYSQGAQVMSEFARTVGAGEGPVPADRVAGIALFADPDRAPGSALFPGRPGQLTPDPAPGTSGAAVAGVRITTTAPPGGGIASDGVAYGGLTGRVADVCAAGDLSCAAPDHAAGLRLVAEVAAQADLRDPVAALGSIHALLSGALGEAWTTVVLEDFRTGPGGVDYAPQATLAQRLTAAGDPRASHPSPGDAAVASARWSQITSIVAGDPLGQLPKLAGQLNTAWGHLVSDNADLLNPGVWLTYSDVIGRHTGYAATGQLSTGVAWMTALAHDLAGRH